MTKYLQKIYRAYPKNVWNVLFVIMFFVARKTFFNIHKEVGTYDAAVDSTTSLALIGIGLAVLYFNSHLKCTYRVAKFMLPILLYYLFAWLSFLWADEKGAFVTISFKVLENIVNIFLVGAMAYYVRDSKKLMYIYILFVTLIICVSLLSIYYQFGLGLYHTNSYTFLALIGMLLCIGSIRYKVFKFNEIAIPLIICTFAWLTGTSTASYISGLAGILVLFSSRRNGVNAVACILVLIISIVFWILLGDYIYEFIAAGHTKQAMETGTGREKLWTSAITLWKESPWFGKGYILGETGLANMGQHSSHNSFISVLVNTGIIGELLFVYSFIKWTVSCFVYSKQNIYANIIFPVIIAIFVNLNSCPALGSHWSIITDTILLGMAAIFLNYSKPDLKRDTRTVKDLLKNKIDL